MFHDDTIQRVGNFGSAGVSPVVLLLFRNYHTHHSYTTNTQMLKECETYFFTYFHLFCTQSVVFFFYLFMGDGCCWLTQKLFGVYWEQTSDACCFLMSRDYWHRLSVKS